MAKAPAAAGTSAAKDKDKKADGSSKGFIIAIVALTIVGGAGGYIFATQVLKPPAVAEASLTEVETKQPSDGKEHGNDAVKDKSEPKLAGRLVPLPPIVTNLLEPSNVFIRVEGSILVDPEFSDDASLAAKVSEDVMVLLKTLTLARIQGASGLSHLREDINDRVKIRSENKARELIINTLVIE